MDRKNQISNEETNTHVLLLKKKTLMTRNVL